MNQIALNKIIAVVKGKKARAATAETRLHQRNQIEQLKLVGMSKTFKPLNEDSGYFFPEERREVQTLLSQQIGNVLSEMADFWDCVATQETGNTAATADVTVDGTVIYKDAPVSVLLFLEKQLGDLRTLVQGLSTLPMDRSWKWDPNKNCYVSEPEVTIKTQKVQKPIVLYDATDKHPAQTQMVTEDERIGTWTTIHFNGSIPVQAKQNVVRRIDVLREAVKMAREEANSSKVDQIKIGEELLDFVFGEDLRAPGNN